MDEARTKIAVEQFGFTQEQADEWLSKWKEEHHDGDTPLSYIDWLKHKIAAAQDELIPTANRALDVLEVSARVADSATVRRDLANVISLVAPNLASERNQARKEAL